MNEAPNPPSNLVVSILENANLLQRSINLLSGVVDVDSDVLIVSNVQYSENGSTYADSLEGFTLTSNDVLVVDTASFAQLRDGQRDTAFVRYKISDGEHTVSRQAEIRIIGVNSIPMISEALDVDFSQNDGVQVIDLLSGITDEDNELSIDSSSIVITVDGTLESSLPEGFTISNSSLTVDTSAYRRLDLGDDLILNLNYDVSDGSETVSQMATVTITGVNDTPELRSSSSARVNIRIDEPFSLDLNELFVDADEGDSLTFSTTPLPTGLTLVGSILSGEVSLVQAPIIALTVTDGTTPIVEMITLNIFDNVVAGLSESAPASVSTLLLSLEREIDRVDRDTPSNISNIRTQLEILFATTATTTEEQVDIIETLAPRNNTTVSAAVDKVVNDVSNSIQNQAIKSIPTGLITVNGPDSRKGKVNSKSKFYYNVSYHSGNQDGEASAVGYDYDGYGIGLGYDVNYGAVYVGGEVSYIGSTTDSDGNAGVAELDSLSFSVYGNYKKGKQFALSSFTLGFTDISSTRTTALDRLRGSADALFLDISALYGYIFKYKDVKLTAIGGVRFSNSTLGDLREIGVGSVVSEGKAYNSLYFNVGGIASKEVFKKRSSYNHQLSISGSLAFNLLDVERDLEDRFNDGIDVFKTQGVDEARVDFNLGFGWRISKDAVLYEFGYNINVNSSSFSNSLNAKITHNF